MYILNFLHKRRQKSIQKSLDLLENLKKVTEKQINCDHTFQIFDEITQLPSHDFNIKYLVIVKYCPKCNYTDKTFINITI